MTLHAAQPLYLSEDNLIRWDRAQLASDSSYVNSGTASWELKNEDGLSLGTGILSYVATTRGRWQGAIPSTLTTTLTEGSTYSLEITLTNGAGADGFRKIELIAEYHDS